MSELEKAIEFNREIKNALLTVWEALNQGQRQKLMKDKQVSVLYERYGLSDAGA